MRLGNPFFGRAIILLVLPLASCSPPRAHDAISKEATAAVPASDALVQYSLVAALAAGDYDGGIPLSELLRGGDFGVGTFSRLDGEMLVLDGRVYQALADRSIREAPASERCPFAAVKFFAADGQIGNLESNSLAELDKLLDGRLPRRNIPYAIRIDGLFDRLTLRSVPAQKPPYEPLIDVIRHQVTWQSQNIRGTLVGLRCPQWVGTLNVAGYHWHFLSDDRQTGGHVLDCAFDGAQLKYDECESLLIRLPTSPAFDEFDSHEIQGSDIDQIERQRD
jgi:acetolactate decarboxylase